MKRSTLCALIIICAAPYVTAQKSDSKEKRSAKKSHVVSDYDRFKDQTFARVELGNVIHLNALAATLVDHYEIYAGAFVLAHGQGLSKPLAVGLRFNSVSSDWRFVGSDPSLLAIVDGQRIDLGKAHRTRAEVQTAYRDVYVTEGLVVEMPLEEFKKLCSAQAIEMQLGGYEFKLKEKQIALLRELAVSLP